MNFAKFSRKPFLQSTSERLLLLIANCSVGNGESILVSDTKIISMLFLIIFARESNLFLIELILIFAAVRVCLHFLTNAFRFFRRVYKRFFWQGYRSSRSQMFFKIGVLKNFAIFTGRHLFWSLFLIKLQALGLQLY